jgi:hypothetical protein
MFGRSISWTAAVVIPYSRTSAASDLPRVVSADFGLTPRATVLEAGEPFIALNSCYVVSCASPVDAYALATLLNSSLAAAWLNSLAEPARGGYRRYLGWTLSLLPIPTNWSRARALLAPIGERAMRGDVSGDDEILTAVLDAYQLDLVQVRRLLRWTVDCDWSAAPCANRPTMLGDLGAGDGWIHLARPHRFPHRAPASYRPMKFGGA